MTNAITSRVGASGLAAVAVYCVAASMMSILTISALLPSSQLPRLVAYLSAFTSISMQVGAMGIYAAAVFAALRWIETGITWREVVVCVSNSAWVAAAHSVAGLILVGLVPPQGTVTPDVNFEEIVPLSWILAVRPLATMGFVAVTAIMLRKRVGAWRGAYGAGLAAGVVYLVGRGLTWLLGVPLGGSDW